MAGGLEHVVAHARLAGKFHFWPELNAVAMIAFISGLLTMGFGSIPQQDVFQRANAAKSEKVAVWGSVLGGLSYFLFAAVPLFLAYAATQIDGSMVSDLLAKGESQQILPMLVVGHLPLFAQIIFYGALLSVIMSTASGTLLAPSVTLSENVIKGFIGGRMTDKHFLWLTRTVVAFFTACVVAYSLWALRVETGIHQMVENAYKVTLVMAFTPLVAGLYWKPANKQGATLAIVLGLLTWIPLEFISPEGEGMIPPQFAGFLASLLGMVIGSLMPEVRLVRHHRRSSNRGKV